MYPPALGGNSIQYQYLGSTLTIPLHELHRNIAALNDRIDKLGNQNGKRYKFSVLVEDSTPPLIPQIMLQYHLLVYSIRVAQEKICNLFKYDTRKAMRVNFNEIVIVIVNFADPSCSSVPVSHSSGWFRDSLGKTMF